MDNADLLFLILDCQRKEPHFRAEIGEKAQNVLDIGTGDGTWAIKVAEKYPNCEPTFPNSKIRTMGRMLTGLLSYCLRCRPLSTTSILGTTKLCPGSR